MGNEAGTPMSPGTRRDRIAMVLAAATLCCVAAVFFLSNSTQVLMPGPLASAHGSIEACSTCHTRSGTGKLGWIRGLVSGDRLADSKACLTCHNMPDTAFNAHGASVGVILESSKRLKKTASVSKAPLSSRAQSHLFPAEAVSNRLYCATCHQEHQGISFDLSKISNEQCRSCHTLKFDSFDGRHPKFESYPFARRTRIVYDHASHFGKHYPEVARKEPAKRIPETCSACHNSRDDKRLMTVAPFDQTCSTCHLGQIVGTERASGPKGIAFLTVPGIDVQTMKARKAAIGEWPEESEAALSPFMKIMIGKDERGRALLKSVDGLNLLDLASANDGQIKAVTELAWEIKGLFYALIKGKAQDVLGDLGIGSGAKLSSALVADLTASIPRDVVIAAHQEWLPNLAAEMANRPASGGQNTTGWSPMVADPEETAQAPATDETANASINGSAAFSEDSASAPAAPALDHSETSDRPAAPGAEAKAPSVARDDGLDPPVCIASIFGQCLIFKEQGKAKTNGGQEPAPARELPGQMNAGVKYAQTAAQPGGSSAETHSTSDEMDPAVKARWPLPSGTPRSIEAQSKDAATAAKPVVKTPPNPREVPATSNAIAAPPEAAGGQTTPAKAEPGGSQIQPPASATPAPASSGKQTDDLLFPTEAEQREINAHRKGGAALEGVAGQAGADVPVSAPSAPAGAAVASTSQTKAAPVISIASDVDPESWAEHGGWYRQDHAILYRPAGHKDKFIYSWLFLTGPQARKGGASPAAAVFDYLTSKDAQGSCTKCHSVDDLESKGQIVNFSPLSMEGKKGRFTAFVHEPHFGIVGIGTEGQDNRGCLACHSLAKSEPMAFPAHAQPASPAPGTAVAANSPTPSSAPANTVTSEANADANKAVSLYLKSYEQANPHVFASGFGSVNKDLCQTCHTATKARQDCLLCHKYHVNGATSPAMTTKNPIK